MQISSHHFIDTTSWFDWEEQINTQVNVKILDHLFTFVLVPSVQKIKRKRHFYAKKKQQKFIILLCETSKNGSQDSFISGIMGKLKKYIKYPMD